MSHTHRIARGLLIAVTLLAGRAWCQAPDLTTNQTVGVNESAYFFLGPTGAKGWMYWSSLTSEARQILVTETRAGTPSDGVLEYHDVILGINGNLFTNDARAAFTDGIVDAQAAGNNGELYLTVFRPSIAETNALVATNTLMVQLQELGTRNEATTPYGCDWVDGVLSNYCEYVYANGPTGDPTKYPSIWTMLASGAPKYVDWACNYITNQAYATRTDLSVYKDTDYRVWFSGYELVTLCQYYLLTNDDSVTNSIADLANFIAEGQDLHGLWGHTMAWPQDNGGELHGTLPGYGALNNAGLVALYGLALAQNCGVTNDVEVNTAVDKAAHFFRSNMYIGAINYGFNPPVDYVTDSNGRMGIAAHVFRALGDPEAAKWFAMMTSTYKFRDWGHTGNEFNHCWGPMAADVGGPDLANFVQTEREVSGPYWLLSLVMRMQPEGWFQSQGQQGQGKGRSNGHATGGYGIQLAAGRAHIEITGAGYNTNDYWLTAQEMDDVVFGQFYEGGSSDVSGLTTSQLVERLDLFCPKVAGKVADELASRIASESGLAADMIAIVEDTGAADNERVAALRALGSSNVLVKSTTDSWFYPSQGYVLNWGAANSAYIDSDSWTNVLAAITLFDREVGFDMLTASTYSQKIYTMDLGQLDAAGSNLYYDAVAVILDPNCGGGWFVSSQNIRNWDPLIIARYADSLLRTAEQKAMVYSATDILKHNQIGEGMFCAAVRSSDYWVHYGPSISTDWMDEYGENWGIYSNFTHAIKSYYAHNQDYITAKYIGEFICKEPAAPVQWFRDLIATNIANAVTNPATELADLRYNMTVGDNDDLFHAVCLDRIVAHPDNTDPFVDITNSVGFTTPIVASHWRLYAGAVELGVADTNSVTRWLAALTEAEANNDTTMMAGILHVLAGKAAPEGLTPAISYLTHEDDYVAMGALDLLGAVGTKDELLMVFENYMTNSTLVATSEDGLTTDVGFKSDHWYNANWAAIKGIVERDYSGCLALADQLASSFNTFTSNGTDVLAVPTRCSARTPPFSVLSPEATDREILGFGNGIYAALGLFASDNTACSDALISVHEQNNDNYYGRSQDFSACEAQLKNFTVPQIIAIENSGGTNLWNQRGAMYYLLDRVMSEEVPVTNQYDLFHVRNGAYLTGDYQYYGETWQQELNYRRGVEETDGWFFFSVQ